MIENVIPFLLVGLYFYILSYIDTYRLQISRLQRYSLLVCSLFILCAFAGCRWSPYEVGYDLDVFDYGTYKNIFQTQFSILNFLEEYTSSKSFEIKATEPGYVFYSTLVRTLIGDKYWGFLLITNSICVILFYKSLKRNKIGYVPIFIMLLFYVSRLYFQFNFILLRQSIAICIIWMWGFPYLQDKLYKKFLVTVGIGSLFHFSTLICLLGFFLHKKFNYKYLALISGIFFILGLTHIGDHIINGGIKILIHFIGVSEGIGEKLIKYISEGASYRGLNLLNYIEAIPMFYSSYICIKEGNNEKKRFFNNMFWVYILLITITMNFGFLTRMMQFFMLSYFYLIVNLYMGVNQKRRVVWFSGFNLYLLIYLIRYVFYWFYDTEYSFVLLT